MVRVTEELALSPEHVTLYHTTDPLLGHLPILIFHGPSTTANYTLNSSRVQIHVYSPAGFQSFPRITISPNSPSYTAVNYLPREFQGDEICRALAFGLFKYFTDLPDNVKAHLRLQFPTKGARRPGSGPALFGEQHAADLAEAMVKSDFTHDAIVALNNALQTQHISNVDMDFVLPPGAIVAPESVDDDDDNDHYMPDNDDDDDDDDDIFDPSLRQYTTYTPLIRLFGPPMFLPTSRLRRAPSKPSALNRSRSFTRDQKVDLRMKLGELVDTEERYVMKLNELVHTIADEFRIAAARGKNRPESLSPSEAELERLFPSSADQILQVNSAFVQELRKIMDDSEEDAIHDMESSAPTSLLGGSKLGASGPRAKDPTGALAMARLFLEWFPKFTDCYQDYIRSSQHFPQLLNSFLDQQSSFRQRVNQTGEQAIRSILIEPVQRLPRYSLLIDQIVNCLPITHPALQQMLRARDIITTICSMDDPLPNKPHVASRLRNLIEAWPADLEPQGRIILAADFNEIPPPFQTSDVDSLDRAGILLVFADCVIMLKKTTGKYSGRDLLREIDKPSAAGLLVSMTNAAGGPAMYDLAFLGWHSLADVRFTESVDGQYVWLTSLKDMRGVLGAENRASRAPIARCLYLQENFQGKAFKLSEDIVKARVESRFSEAERENPAWSLRSVRMQDSNLGLFAAVFQEGADQLVEGRKEPAFIRVVVDHEKGTKGAPTGHYGVEIVVNVSASGDRIAMTTVGLNGKQYSDDVAVEDFLPTLSRRVIQLLSTQFDVSNPLLTAALVSYHSKVLRSLSLSTRQEKTRSFLASSPVKLLSSFWNGSSESSNNTTKTNNIRPPVSGLFPPPQQQHQHQQHQHQNQTLSRSNSQQSINDSLRDNRIIMDNDKPENPLVRLEQTFTGYVAALQMRKGSIVGRMLLNRASADELSVNDLYNRLIESPYDFDASAEVGVEIIFVAFEKFLNIAWREQMGPIMTMQALNTLQERLNKRVPGDFADFVNYLFRDMAPQNRRAFTALIKLLSDLLDGCGNDGDRGVLTIVFAELLVTDGCGAAHEYINLLDRLVEDCDRISNPGVGGLLALEALNSTALRSAKSQTGSLTSNTSSIRRKFGFDSLLRQNSKNNSNTNEGDRPSMWRSLSKHKTGSDGVGSYTGSLTKAHVSRSRSIDMGGHNNQTAPGKFRRPGGKDRPSVAGAFEEPLPPLPPPPPARPVSSHKLDFRLETIGEPENEGSSGGKMPRRKRRSSLSDLRSLLAATNLDDEHDRLERLPNGGEVEEPLEDDQDEPTATTTTTTTTTTTLMPLRLSKQTSGKLNNASPRSSTNTVESSTPSRIPISPTAAAALRSPRQKENLGELGAVATPDSLDPVKRHAKTVSGSGIPTLKPYSSTTNRAVAPVGAPEGPRQLPSPTKVGGGSAQKLRLQSPQKLRERLQTEQAALDEADASLRAEICKISEDMARINGGKQPSTTEIRKLQLALQTLEERIPTLLAEVGERQTAMQRDTDAALRAAETKVRAIDQLYKEAMAENELLHERFNGELGKLVRALKGKGREDKEELVARLRDQSEEAARVKKENARLKREMASLRAALKSEQ